VANKLVLKELGERPWLKVQTKVSLGTRKTSLSSLLNKRHSMSLHSLEIRDISCRSRCKNGLGKW